MKYWLALLSSCATLVAWGCDDDPSTTGPASSASTASSGGAAQSVGSGGGGTGPGSGGGGAPVAYDHYVYVANSAGDSIHVWSLDADTGALSAVDELPLAGDPAPLAVDPARRFLFAGLRDAQAVASLAIDQATGMLTVVDTTPVGLNPVYVSVDATGNNLLLADYGADMVAVYAIEQDGSLADTALDSSGTDTNPHSIVPDPSNGFVLVPNTNADKILQFTFDAATGQLQPNTPAQVTTPAGEGPRHLVFHPDGDHVYVVNEHADSVTTFAYDAGSGTLSPLGTVSTLPSGANGAMNTCADIHVSDDGRFVYASNRGHDSLAIFSVDPQDKSLTPVGHQMTEPIPREFELALGGRYLYAAGQNSDQLAAYEADPGTGLLTPIDVYPVGDAPLWVLWVAVPAP